MAKFTTALMERAKLLCEGFRWGVYACMSTTDGYYLDYVRKFGANDLAEHEMLTSSELEKLLDKYEAAKANK